MADEFCWLVEQFNSEGNSTGLYMADQIELTVTTDPLQARRFTRSRSAMFRAEEMDAKHGPAWRATQHGFIEPSGPREGSEPKAETEGLGGEAPQSPVASATRPKESAESETRHEESTQASAQPVVADMRDRIAEAHDACLDDDHAGCRAILKECLRLLGATEASALPAAQPASPEDRAVYSAIAASYFRDTAKPACEAAAPELLHACEQAVEWLEGWASAEPYIGVLRAAIAKAKAAAQQPAVEPLVWIEAEPAAKGVDLRAVAKGLLLSTCWHWQADRPTPMQPDNVLFPLYASPTAQPAAPNPWRQAVDRELVDAGLDCLAPDAEAVPSLTKLLSWRCTIALDPAVSEEAQALIERGQASAPQVVEPAPMNDEQLLAGSQTLAEAIDDEFLKRGDWKPLAIGFAKSAMAIRDAMWKHSIAQTSAPQVVEPAEDLLARIADLEVELDEAKRGPWPEWAERILKLVRERSGYDGYDDQSEGVDLADEVEECLLELERAYEKAAARASAPTDQLTRRTEMLMNPPTVPLNYVNMPSHDELVRVLRLVQHATAPTPDDGGYHEAAHDLASEVLGRVDAATACHAATTQP